MISLSRTILSGVLSAKFVQKVITETVNLPLYELLLAAVDSNQSILNLTRCSQQLKRWWCKSFSWTCNAIYTRQFPKEICVSEDWSSCFTALKGVSKSKTQYHRSILPLGQQRRADRPESFAQRIPGKSSFPEGYKLWTEQYLILDGTFWHFLFAGKTRSMSVINSFVGGRGCWSGASMVRQDFFPLVAGEQERREADL